MQFFYQSPLFKTFLFRFFFVVIYNAKKCYKDLTQILLINVSTLTKITVYSPFQFIIRPTSRNSSIMDKISLLWALWRNRRWSTSLLGSSHEHRFYFHLGSWHAVLLFRLFYLTCLVSWCVVCSFQFVFYLIPRVLLHFYICTLCYLLPIGLSALWLRLWVFVVNNILGIQLCFRRFFPKFEALL